MALRLAGLLAARAPRSYGSATARARANAVGGMRHLTLALPVGRIDVPDFSQAHATPSRKAFDALVETEQKLRSDLPDDQATVAVLRGQVVGLPPVEACRHLLDGLHSPSHTCRRVWLRCCRELMEDEVVHVDTIIEVHILPQVVDLLRGTAFPDVQLEAVRLLTAVAQGGRPGAILDHGAVEELGRLVRSGATKVLREEAGAAVWCAWQGLREAAAMAASPM